MTFRETTLVLFTADLAGYARATAHMAPLEVAAFLDGWYRSIEAILGRRQPQPSPAIYALAR